MACRGLRDGSILRAIDYNILRHHSCFQSAHLRMFTSASEQTRRLNFKVANFFLVSVNNASAIILLYGFIFFFYFLKINCLKPSILLQKCTNQFLFFWHSLSLLWLLLEVGAHRLEVAQGKISDHFLFLACHTFTPVLEEIVVKRFLGGELVLQHLSVEASNLLGRSR